MIFDLHCKSLHAGIEGWSFGDGPRLEDAVYFETKVIVQLSGAMFLDHKHATTASAFLCGTGFRSFIELPLLLVLGEGCHERQ